MQHSDLRLAPKGSKAVPEIQEARKQQEAKERLEAAAPALLAMLREAISALEGGLESDERELELPGSKSDRITVARAHDLIFKATGST